MPSGDSGSKQRSGISIFAISLIVITVALLLLAVVQVADHHTKRAVAVFILTVVVGAGAGYAIYADI